MPRRGSEGNPIDAAVGARIRIRRQQLEMSQSALGAHLGVSFQQIQKYERGGNRISASMLVMAARALECPAASLLGDDQTYAMDAQLLQLLAQPGSVELLEAFAGLRDSETRSAVVAIVRGLTGPEAAAKGRAKQR